MKERKKDMKVLKNVGFSKVELVKGNIGANTVKDNAGLEGKLTGIAICEKAGEDGEPINVTMLKIGDKVLVSTSATVLDSAELISDILTEQEQTGSIDGIDVKVESKKSNAGRNFYYIDLV